jgi:hypothetical protein
MPIYHLPTIFTECKPYYGLYLFITKSRERAIEEEAEIQWENHGEKSQLHLKTKSAEFASGGPVFRNGLTETNLPYIYMSVLLFLARNYSEDADKSMVVDACMNHTHDEPYT